ncbi:MAG: hypothetical protein E6Q98_15960 [Rhodospirillaceae bacterium]|nr:MAG: hypothetical protein E6Q98_15960 [Rhodospirillaceae bacterium]
MSHNMQITKVAASAMMDVFTALLNGGSLKIYDGAQPANANTAITTQKLLATLTFDATAFAPAVDGVAEANDIAPGTISQDGTAAWARCFKADGTTVVCDLSVGASDADVIFPTVTFITGIQAAVDSLTLTHPLH